MERRKDLLALLGVLLLSCWSFLLFNSFIEPGGYKCHSVALDTVGILPLLRLEIAFNREECSFDKAVKGCSILILAPCLDVYESGSAVVSSPDFSVRLIAKGKRATLAVEN